MCGFAGLIDASGRTSPDKLCTAVQSMAGAVRHRGPDDAGAWIDETAGVAFGFRRLSILELSEAGHQPMTSHDGRLVLVFNGEIYNHSELRAELNGNRHAWAGHSDTETLLECFAVWGVKKTLERTVGMFAMAVWNRPERLLYLARDRFGEKPLYYGWAGRSFIFGSELSALRRAPAFDNSIDRDVLALYMQYCCVPAPYSIYRDVYKLEPGCVLTLRHDAAAFPPRDALFAPARHPGLTLERYWSLADVAERGLAHPLIDEHEATDRLEAALADAVRLQSIADVPLGAFLSGGIDSSTIAALMQAQSRRRVETFTIGFEEAAFNEATHARAVAAHLGTDHTELYVSPQQARAVIPKLPELYSEPFADASQIPTHLVSQVARRHVTVALSGDGGDELFGGYTRHLWAPRIWNRLRKVPAPLRRAIAKAITRVPVSTWDGLGRVITGNRVIGRPGNKAHKLAHRLGRVRNVDDLYRSLATTWPVDSGVVSGGRDIPVPLDAAMADCGPAQFEQRMMLWDALTYLPDDILHKVDRASMGVSLETRAPFLDHRVAELAWRLPLHMKIRDGRGKWILRQVLSRHVPGNLVERPKTGFGIPIDRWIRGPLREWAESLLGETALKSSGYFNPEPIRRKWTEHLSGKRDWENELWCVLMFQAWMKAER